jgi:hypothetical protein
MRHIGERLPNVFREVAIPKPRPVPVPGEPKVMSGVFVAVVIFPQSRKLTVKVGAIVFHAGASFWG